MGYPACTKFHCISMARITGIKIIKPMNKPNLLKSLVLMSAISATSQVNAQLQAMDDAALEETVGQAYMRLDSLVGDGVNTGDLDVQYSRLTFGQDVEIQANADELVLGGTDIVANNFSLGYIDTADSADPIKEFSFTNPYLEWATDASNNVIGFRVGAEESKGLLQMDMTSFSGNIDMTINNQAASLFTGALGSQTNNQATYIGESAGSCTDGTDCVSLANITSLDVAGAEANGGTADFFLSFQNAAVNWTNGDNSAMQQASQGFFLNVPTTTNLDVTTTASSTAGYATGFIERSTGIGRWNTPAVP